MTKSNNRLSAVTSLILLVVGGLACGGETGSLDISTSNANSTNASTPSGSPLSGNSNNSSNVATKDISGSYSITGTNESGGGRYEGDLNVTRRDDVYQFSWASGGRTYDGVGVQTGNTVAVSFTEGKEGKGCGVVLYKIAANGDLDGKAGYWGVNKSEMEKALKDTGNDLEGRFEVTGTNTDGKQYKSVLNVKKLGDGYAFEWVGGATPVKGFGIRMGEMAAVGLGQASCGFVMYEVKDDGTLEGKWGGQSSTAFGTETAVKKGR